MGMDFFMPFLLTKNIKIDKFWRKNWKLAKNFWKLDINIEFEVETQGKKPKLKGKTQPLGSSFSACGTKWCYKKKPELLTLYNYVHFLWPGTDWMPRPTGWCRRLLQGWPRQGRGCHATFKGFQRPHWQILRQRQSTYQNLSVATSR